MGGSTTIAVSHLRAASHPWLPFRPASSLRNGVTKTASGVPAWPPGPEAHGLITGFLNSRGVFFAPVVDETTGARCTWKYTSGNATGSSVPAEYGFQLRFIQPVDKEEGQPTPSIPSIRTIANTYKAGEGGECSGSQSKDSRTQFQFLVEETETYVMEMVGGPVSPRCASLSQHIPRLCACVRVSIP